MTLDYYMHGILIIVSIAVLLIIFLPHPGKSMVKPNCLLMNKTKAPLVNGVNGPTCYIQGSDDAMKAAGKLIDKCAKSDVQPANITIP